jgi:hypothetical protein
VVEGVVAILGPLHQLVLEVLVAQVVVVVQIPRPLGQEMREPQTQVVVVAEAGF